MSLTRLQIRNNTLENLTGARIDNAFYQTEDLNDSIQDGYNEVIAKTRCLVKMVNCNWQDGKNYYDPILDLGIGDFLGIIAIFDNNSNLWLRDDVTIRDFNRIRRDWELWTGNSQFWAPHSQRRFAVCPALTVGTGTFDLWYYATAPELIDDTVATIIANDMDLLISDYSSLDLLESAQEITKAQPYLLRFLDKLERYEERAHNSAAHQLLMRI